MTRHHGWSSGLQQTWPCHLTTRVQRQLRPGALPARDDNRFLLGKTPELLEGVKMGKAANPGTSPWGRAGRAGPGVEGSRDHVAPPVPEPAPGPPRSH